MATLLTAVATRQTLAILFPAALIGGFFYTGFEVSSFEWMLQIMPEGERPRYVAMNTALMNLVAFAVPMAGAACAEWAGIRAVLVASGLCFFASAALAMRFRTS